MILNIYLRKTRVADGIMKMSSLTEMEKIYQRRWDMLRFEWLNVGAEN